METKAEQIIDSILEKSESKAWELVKDRMIKPHMTETQISYIKSSFLAGYNLGSYMAAEELMELYKTDPVLFFEMLKG